MARRTKQWDTKKHQQVLREKKEKEKQAEESRKWFEAVRREVEESTMNKPDLNETRSETDINMNKWW